MQEPTFPGAEPPERRGEVTSSGLRLNLLEWGDPAADPLVLCHGMWDHAHSFAVLAPLLARRYRVVALDARGHGDSAWAAAYSWLTDVLDIVAVLRALGRPVHLVGHSKGGGQATEAARAVPALVRKLVNVDGFGPPPFGPDEPPPPTQLAAFLNIRRRLAGQPTWRPYASLDDLVERRRKQNPRLSRDWLRFFAYHAARREKDGWRWKADPHMAHSAGPWRPEWLVPILATVRVPMLALVGSQADTWGPLPEDILAPRLAGVPDLVRVTIRGAGHFVHVERPVETADAILDFLG
jgi:pimeloyl-ACP methyl ester carboxylesterase